MKIQNDTLDKKLLNAINFIPMALYFLSRYLFGSSTPVVKSVETAQLLVPKLATNIEFVSSNYSSSQANDFALFFANYYSLTVIVLGVRFTVFRNQPYSHADRASKRLVRFLPLYPIGAIIIVLFVPSFFAKPDEYSLFTFHPGIKSEVFSSIFLIATSAIIYVAMALWFAPRRKDTNQTIENTK